MKQILAGLFTLFLLFSCQTDSGESEPSFQAKPTGTTFTYAGTALQVFLVGDFNEWKPEDPNFEMFPNSEGVFEITLNLNKGTYLYKYYIDGSWTEIKAIEDLATPKPAGYKDDGFGGWNAEIRVP